MGRSSGAGERVLLRPFVGNDRRISRGDAETRRNLDTSPGELRRKHNWRETELGETNQRGTTLQDNQSLSASRRLRAETLFRVSLTMIVRDEEKNLAACLGSVRGLFDEIVIVDTGSTDRTVEIARSFGARCLTSSGSTTSPRPATPRWRGPRAIMPSGSTPMTSSTRPSEQKLEAHCSRDCEDGRRAAYVVKCACDPGQDGSGGDTVVDHIRLFPLREDVRWTYRVHEQILPALRRAGVPVHWTDVTVRHTGYTDRALRARKLDRDANILCRNWPNGPTTHSSCSTWGRSPSSGKTGAGARLSSPQPGWLGADRLDHAQAVSP